jgi:hypothetical protein
MERMTRLALDNAQWKKTLDWFDEQLGGLGQITNIQNAARNTLSDPEGCRS